LHLIFIDFLNLLIIVIISPICAQILLEISDDFIENVTSFGCALAKHRNSDTLEVKDLRLHLEKNWNIRIPGSDEPSAPKQHKRSQDVDVHRMRLRDVRKSQNQLQKQHEKQKKKDQNQQQQQQFVEPK